MIDGSGLDKIVNILLPHVMDRRADITEAKLFNSLIFQGFGTDLQPTLDLLLTPLFIVLICYMSLPQWIKERIFPENPTILVILGVWYLVIMQVLASIGRQNTVMLLRSKLVSHRLEIPAPTGMSRSYFHFPKKCNFYFFKNEKR